MMMMMTDGVSKMEKNDSPGRRETGRFVFVMWRGKKKGLVRKCMCLEGQGREGGQERPGHSKYRCSRPSCLEEEDCGRYMMIQVCLEFPWDFSQDEIQLLLKWHGCRVASNLENLEKSGNLKPIWKTWKSQGISLLVSKNE